jgi:hypothetical protein
MSAVETADQPPPGPPPPYGIFATLAWVMLAGIASLPVTLIALYVWYPDRFGTGNFDFGYDGQMFARVLIPSNLVQIAVLMLAARLRRWPPLDYLGFVLPTARNTVFALVLLLLWLLGTDTATYLLGKPVVTPFQTELYTSARAASAVLPLWIALVLVGPLGEEVMFRGFLYRGWVRPGRAVWPAIVLISALWAVIHVQYDWFGIFQVFLTGLLFGWVRLWSGSATLTFLMHAVMNAWATVETIIKLDWLS